MTRALTQELRIRVSPEVHQEIADAMEVWAREEGRHPNLSEFARSVLLLESRKILKNRG
jgi:hypothetical protein